VDPAAGALEELQHIIAQIRGHWPQVEILVRGDSAYSRDDIMSWFGTIRHKLLKLGDQIRISVRRLLVAFGSASPIQAIFAAVYQQLQRLSSSG